MGLGGNEFREPKVLRSIDGKLQLTLTVEMANLTFDWFSTIRRTYNGSVPGPTWRIRPGDNVTVVLVSATKNTPQTPALHRSCKKFIIQLTRRNSQLFIKTQKKRGFYYSCGSRSFLSDGLDSKNAYCVALRALLEVS